LKITSASEYTSLSVSTLRRLVRRGILPAVKVGRSVRLRLADLYRLACVGAEWNNDEEE
jgi:excisionase family DNA binding protein